MDLMDSASPVEAARSRCFDVAAAAFSNNQLSLETYEALAGEIATTNELAALQEIEKALPAVHQSSPAGTQQITADRSKVTKQGRWVESPRVAVRGNMSKITLDFTDYLIEKNLRLDLELDCTASDIRIVVPRNIDVVERLASNKMSVFRDKRRPTPTNNVIVVFGKLSMSKVKIKRKKVRQIGI